jgi:hypothetical protein
MALSILCKEIISVDEVFKNVCLVAIKGRLFCIINDNILKETGHIENINFRKYYGKKEDDYDYFLMDIYNSDRVINFMSKVIIDNEIYYCLAGTDNTPSKLCYDFSLAYLRLCPEHLISIYDWVFSLEDIEQLESKGGWYETWYQDFSKLESPHV